MQATFRAFPLTLLCLASAFGLAACLKKSDSPSARDAEIAAALAAAQSQLAAGQSVVAIATLEQTRAGNPDRADVLEALALAHSHAGHPTQAAAYFQQAAARDPDRRPLLIYAAGLYAESGDHDHAVPLYQEYLQAFPEDPAAWKGLAQSLHALNQTKPALDAYLESLNRVPDHQPAARDALEIARLFLQLGNIPLADTWFAKTIQLNPHPDVLAQARLGLLEIALKQSNWAEAENIMAVIDADAAGQAALAGATRLAPARDQLRQWHDAQAALERERLAAEAAAAQRERDLATLAANPPAPPPPPTPTPVEIVAATPVQTPSLPPAPLVAETSAQPAPQPETPNPKPETPPPSPPPTPTQTPAPAPQLETPNPKPETPPPPPPPSPAAPFIAEGRRAHDADNLPDAIRAYWKALAVDDSNPDTWLALAQCYFAAKQYPNATNTVQEALRRAPNSLAGTITYLDIIQASQPSGRYQTELAAAFDKFPASADLAYTYAEFLRQQGSNRAAAAAYSAFLSRAAANDPRRAEAELSLRSVTAP